MKIIQTTSKFRPITITLETQYEVATLHNILELCTPVRTKGVDHLVEFANDVRRKLEEYEWSDL